jgi:hypothetical protein
MSLARIAAPLGAGYTAAIESLLLPALIVGAGIWLNPLDPLWVRAEFPWAWLAPLVLALRYGPFSGLFGALLLLAAWFGLQPLGFVRGDFPKLYFLGGLLVVMLCGEFSSIWRARVRRAEGMQIYLDQRLDNLTHQHYLLRLSHDRLEQDLIARPMSMRDSLSALRRVAEEADPAQVLAGAGGFLKLLAQYCQIDNAAVYAVNGTTVCSSAEAHIGAKFDIDPADPLVVHAMKTGRISHIQGDGGVGGPRSRYLVGAPLGGADGVLRGLLLVERIPFFAFNEETLQTIALMLVYYSDGLDARATARPLLDAIPECPLEFGFELMRLWRIRKEAGVKSALVALSFAPRESYEDLPYAIRRQQRSLDVTWMIETGPLPVLVTLMPLASRSGAEGYLARIEGWYRQRSGRDLAAGGVSSRVFEVDDVEPITMIRRLLRIFHDADQARPVGTHA